MIDREKETIFVNEAASSNNAFLKSVLKFYVDIENFHSSLHTVTLENKKINKNHVTLVGEEEQP